MAIQFRLTNCTLNTPWLDPINITSSPSRCISSIEIPLLTEDQFNHLLKIFTQLTANRNISHDIPFRFAITASDGTLWPSITFIKKSEEPEDNTLFIHYQKESCHKTFEFSKGHFSEITEKTREHNTPPCIRLSTSHYVYNGMPTNPFSLKECSLTPSKHPLSPVKKIVLKNDVVGNIFFSPLFNLIDLSLHEYFQTLIQNYKNENPLGLLSPIEPSQNPSVTDLEVEQLLHLYHFLKTHPKTPLGKTSFTIKGYKTSSVQPILLKINKKELEQDTSCEINFMLNLACGIKIRYNLTITNDQINFVFNRP